MILSPPADDAPALVCIVDDDPTALAATAAVLRGAFEIVAARSGADALRLMARQVPDIVLLDVDMPGLDGLAVCRQLKADAATQDVPVVFLTAQSDEATELRGLAAGAADFIAKPPRGPAVVARLNNLVRLRRLTERLRHASLTDGLTGLRNRACLDQALPLELARAQRHGQALALLLIDVDHFKAFNDHYGHQAGDDALREVALVLAGTARRAGDLACRYGGEEFALLLPATDAAGAERAALGVLEALAQRALPHAASPTATHVTASIGVALAGFGSGPARGADQLIAQADAALYAAKRQGRQQAWIVGPGGTPVALGLPTSASASELAG